MIHDKDYIIRIVKQFSEMLTNRLLGKNEGKLADEQVIFETQMKDVFKMTFEELSAKNSEDIMAWVDSKDTAHHIAYYDLLGNLFFYKYKEAANMEFAKKAKLYYEMWLQKSQIFSLPVMARIGELNKFFES